MLNTFQVHNKWFQGESITMTKEQKGAVLSILRRGKKKELAVYLNIAPVTLQKYLKLCFYTGSEIPAALYNEILKFINNIDKPEEKPRLYQEYRAFSNGAWIKKKRLLNLDRPLRTMNLMLIETLDLDKLKRA